MPYIEADTTLQVAGVSLDTEVMSTIIVEALYQLTGVEVESTGGKSAEIGSVYFAVGGVSLDVAVGSVRNISAGFQLPSVSLNITAGLTLNAVSRLSMPDLLLDNDAGYRYNMSGDVVVEPFGPSSVAIVFLREDDNIRLGFIGTDGGWIKKKGDIIVRAFFYDLNGHLYDPDDIYLLYKKPGKDPVETSYVEGEVNPLSPVYDKIFKISKGSYGVKVHVNKNSHWYFDWKTENPVESSARIVLRAYIKGNNGSSQV